MKKKILFILVGLMLVGTVIAISVGTIYTQAQIDTIDVSVFDLEEQFVRDGSNNIEYECEGGICEIKTEILDITKEMLINQTDNSTYWSGDWKVIYPASTIKFRKQRWADLRDETNVTYARQGLVRWLKAQRSRLVAQRRIKLEGIQTQTEIDLSDVLDSLQ